MSVRDAYRAALAAGSHQPDPAQAAAVDALDKLQLRLLNTTGDSLLQVWERRLQMWERRLRAAIGIGTRQMPVTGLYLHGGVGRGKTWLMDLFHDTLPLTRKRRVHFHRFMREVHQRLTALGEVHDPLKHIAADVSRDIDVLCFDELFVADIGDAMILGTLLEALFARGVTLVATSNQAPSELYRDGLQRARFLPAIAAIERHCAVLEIGAGVDFRLRALEQAPLYLHPAGPAADAALAEAFERVATTSGAPATLEIEGRPITARRATDGVVWFDFAALCDGPRGAADYIEIARDYHTVLISDIPRFDESLDNQARRFVTLVDEFYDRRVKLVVSAATAPAGLYAGERLTFEFQRTASRLLEMQSRDYLAQPHLG